MSKHSFDPSDYDEGMYSQERNNEVADHLESYVEAITTLFILEGKDAEEVENACKVIKKAVKNLRNGKPEKVYDEEEFEKYMMSRG